MITYMTFGLLFTPFVQYFMDVSIMFIADARSLFFLYIVLHLKDIFPASHRKMNDETT
jgi:hypothetical protein